MRKLLVLGLFSLTVAPIAHADITWSTQAGTRYVSSTANDGLETKDAAGKDQSKTTTRQWQWRGFLGAAAKGETIDWGIDLRTFSSATSEWVTNTNGQDLGAFLGQAYTRWHSKAFDSDFVITIGRQKNVLMTDNLSQVLFDNDVRWDGLSEQWTMGMFGFTMTQYVLGATSRGGAAQASTLNYTESTDSNPDTQSHFASLLAFQPWIQLKINDEISGKFAIGYLNWSGTGISSTRNFYTNAIHGGTAASTAVGDNVTAMSLDDSRQWQLYTDWTLPMSFRFVAEYIKNKERFYGRAPGGETVKADRDAIGLSLAWGKPKKARDFGVGYSFTDKGIAAVVNTFTFGDAPSDNCSHLFDVKYMATDNWSVAAKLQFHKEKAHLDGAGAALAAPNDKRDQTRKRYELITAVAF